MGRSIRSKKVRANKAALRARYAPKELEKLKQTVAKLPLAPKVEMETDEGAETKAQDSTTADVSMGGEGGVISKSQIKKKLAKKSKLKSKLKKKSIAKASKQKGRIRV